MATHSVAITEMTGIVFLLARLTDVFGFFIGIQQSQLSFLHTPLHPYAHAHMRIPLDIMISHLMFIHYTSSPFKTEVEVDVDVAGTFEPYPVQAMTPLVG